jgi:undecaprenyl-diphosphatase
MIEYLILGFLQGITEWLPISSQGMVTIAGPGLGLEKNVVSDLAIWLHLGTLLAAIIYFRKDLVQLVRLKKKRLLRFLIISTVVSAVIGGPLYLWFREVLGLASELTIMALVGAFLIITGLVQHRSKSGMRREKEIEDKDSLFGGIAQGLAALPGISRSGMTMSALLFSGFQSQAAIRLSFLMSIFGVTAAQIGLQLRGGFEISIEALVAMLVTLIVGLLTIDLFLKLAKRINFGRFCIFLGSLTIAASVIMIVVLS